jgi:hypothetical protein
MRWDTDRAMKSLARLLPVLFAVLPVACSGAPREATAPRAEPAPVAAAADARPASPAVVEETTRVEVAAAPEAPAVPALKSTDHPGAKRIASIGDFSYIYKKPEHKGLALGYIRMGTSVALKSDKPVPEGKGCGRGWYAVEPRGYVCLDPSTTLDLDDPYYKALQTVAPKNTEVWPYSYAFSNGAPMYSRVPTPEEAAKAEKSFGPPGSFVQLAEWSAGHEELILNGTKIEATDPVPYYFEGGKRHIGGGPVRDAKKLVWKVIPNGSMLAYAKAFEMNGRVWLVTPDLTLVPADRVRPFRRSTFHGVDLGDDVKLPLAWNRTKGVKPRFKKDDAGHMVEADHAFGPKSWIQITGDRVVDGKKTYFAVRGEPNLYVAEGDVTVTKVRDSLPRGIQEGQKWIEVKIVPGTLTAYVGSKPVRATMFSPGKGGAPVPGFDPYFYSMTKTGHFPIEWKDRVAIMSPDKGPPTVLWFTDVPNIQYLRAPLAMHASYWHEDFGNPKSAECVNVAPADAKWLFDWTLPSLPEGWGGMRPGDGAGPGTPIVSTAL